MNRLPCARCSLILIALIPCICAGCDRGGDEMGAVESIFGSTGLGAGEFSYPRAMTVSPIDGCVFVVDKTARIQRFSPDGRYETGWRMPEWENGKPTGLCADRDNRLWVADTHYARVIAFDREGKELCRFGSLGEGPGQFTFPTDVAIDRDGFIYVGEYGGNDRISKFSQSREYLLSFADKTSGAAWVERPQSLAFDANDILWVADSCHHRICRYDRSGKFLGAFPTPQATGGESERQPSLSYPYGLAFEPDGGLLVADRGNNRIVRFNSAGRFMGSWGSPGRAPGQIAQPWDVGIRRDGAIYVLDSWNNRVQVVNW